MKSGPRKIDKQMIAFRCYTDFVTGQEHWVTVVINAQALAGSNKII